MRFECSKWPPSNIAEQEIQCDSDSSLFLSSLPSSLFTSSSSLSILSLNHNQLQGSLPHMSSSKLTFLSLRNNSLSGAVPDLLPLHLEYLDLSHNHFTGKLPSLLHLQNLSYLDLSGNQFFVSQDDCIPCPNAQLCETPLRVHNAEWCPAASLPRRILQTKTFETDSQIFVIFISLFALLFGLFLCCGFMAVILRRRRELEKLVYHQSDQFQPVVVPQEEGRPISRRAESGASSNRGGVNSFDTRSGWKSDATLRASTRRNFVEQRQQGDLL